VVVYCAAQRPCFDPFRSQPLDTRGPPGHALFVGFGRLACALSLFRELAGPVHCKPARKIGP